MTRPDARVSFISRGRESYVSGSPWKREVMRKRAPFESQFRLRGGNGTPSGGLWRDASGSLAMASAATDPGFENLNARLTLRPLVQVRHPAVHGDRTTWSCSKIAVERTQWAVRLIERGSV